MTDRKLPAIQFYPGDWLRDPGVRACSLQARGLWIEMLCLMHDGSPYGHLTINGRSIDTRTLSRLVGAEMKRTSASLKELETNGVFSRTKDGIIYSRRMVKDAYLRAIRAKAGSEGGKATTIKVQNLLKQMPEQKAKQTPPPSSSSSDVKGLQPKPLSRKTGVKHQTPAREAGGLRLGLAPDSERQPEQHIHVPEPGNDDLTQDPIAEMKTFIRTHIPQDCEPAINDGILKALLSSRALFELKAAWILFVRPGTKSHIYARGQSFSTLEFQRQINILVNHEDYAGFKRRFSEAELEEAGVGAGVESE